MSTSVVRVPDDVHREATQMAALRGEHVGQLLAEAWRAYVASNRERFAQDLEQAAELIRNGDTAAIAAFAGRHNRRRAELAAAAARGTECEGEEAQLAGAK
jgi:hypothetical protein